MDDVAITGQGIIKLGEQAKPLWDQDTEAEP